MEPNQIIELSDFNSLVKSKNKTNVYSSLSLVVERIGRFSNDLGSMELVYMTTGEVLTILTVDGKKQILVITPDPEFIPKNRADLIQENQYWIFQEPPDEWQLNDLKFTTAITDDVSTFEYNQEFQFLGNYEETPQRTGLTDLFAGFTQYVTDKVDDKTDNKFVIITEIGNILSENGGLVSIYKGYSIEETDLRII